MTVARCSRTQAYATISSSLELAGKLCSMVRLKPEAWVSFVAEAALATLIVLLPLALGGAPGWVIFPLVGLSTLSAGTVLLSALSKGRKVAWPFWMWVPLAGAVLCAVQLVPLPRGLLAWVSPSAFELREFSLQPFGDASAWAITLDPPGTWRELAKHVSYAFILFSAASMAGSSSRRRRMLSVLVGTGTLVALLGLGHLLVNAETLLGWHRFGTPPPLITPFGNPNHLAGFVGLCASVALGLGLSAPTRSETAAWLWLYALLGGAVLLSVSMGGIVFFFVAQLCVGVFLWWGRKSKDRRRLTFMLALVGMVAVGGLLAFERVSDELQGSPSVEDLRQSKIQTWPMFARAAWRFSGTGMGRGAFEPGFTQFQYLYPEFTFTHPENGVLQLWAEFGLVSMLFLLGLAAWGLWRALQRSELGILDVALLCGATGLLLQNLFDFSLELPAAASALALVLGIFARPTQESPSLGTVPTAQTALRFLVPAGLAALLGLFLGLRDLRGDQQSLLAAYDQGQPAKAVEAMATPMMLRHPAASLLFSIVGRAHASRPDGSVRRSLMYINRALYLRPLDAEAHRAAARTLLRTRSREQAFLEYRLAYEAGIPRHKLLDEAIPQATTVGELYALAPTQAEILAEICDRLIVAKRASDAEALATYGIDNILDDSVAVLHLARAGLLQSKDLDSAWKDVDAAEKLAPDHPRMPTLKATLLRLRGKPEDAIRVLEAATVKTPARLVLWIHLAEHLMLFGKTRAALDAIKRAHPFVDSTQQRSDLLWWEGNIHRKDDRFANALEAFRSAARLTPERPAFHYSVAQMYLELGRLQDAREAVRRGRGVDAPPFTAAVDLDGKIAQREGEQAEQLQRLEQRRLAEDGQLP
jgi:predicted Zn-dependent protease